MLTSNFRLRMIYGSHTEMYQEITLKAKNSVLLELFFPPLPLLDEEDFITLPLIGKMKENNIFHCSRATQNEIIITMFLISCKNTIRNTLKYLDPDVTLPSMFSSPNLHL